MTEQTSNRVWIEVEKPWTKGGGFDHALGHARAKLYSNLLIRLGIEADPEPIWWSEAKNRFCYNKFGHGGYVELDDWGEWFSLDYVGRDV